MRRRLFTPLMAAMVGLVGLTGDAGATVTFDLIWTATTGFLACCLHGTNTLWAAPGDVVTLEIRMTTDQTLAAYSISLNFDTDLGNELNLLSTSSWSGSTFGTSATRTVFDQIGNSPGSTVESTSSTAGRINSYNAGVSSGPLFLPTGTYAIGTARFLVIDFNRDLDDVTSGLFNDNLDGVGDSTLNLIPSSGLVFHSASLSDIPEPGAVALLGLGLAVLTLARRRR